MGRFEDYSYQDTAPAPAEGVGGQGAHVVASWDPSAGLDTAGSLVAMVCAKRRSDGAIFLDSRLLHYVRRNDGLLLHTPQACAVPLATGALAGLSGIGVELAWLGTEIRVQLVLDDQVPGDFDVSTFLEARGFTV